MGRHITRFEIVYHDSMKVTFEMRSPVVTTDYIFLDGLVSSAVFTDCVPNYYDMPENRNELIHIPLPLKQYGTKEPFYAASIGFADKIVEGIDHWRKRTEIEKWYGAEFARYWKQPRGGAKIWLLERGIKFVL